MFVNMLYVEKSPPKRKVVKQDQRPQKFKDSSLLNVFKIKEEELLSSADKEKPAKNKPKLMLLF